MKHMQTIVFFNGKFISEEKARIPISTHALHYGTGVFEGIRAYYKEVDNALLIFRMQDHYKRMHASCKTVHIHVRYTIDELCDITAQLLKKNFQKTDLYIRPLAFKVGSAVGNFNLPTLADSFAMYTVPLGRYGKREGLRAMITSWERISATMIPPQAKITGSYINSALAKTQALKHGFDEAIFLNRDGNVVEGSVQNIFIVKNEKVITPPVNDDILEGITRDTVMLLCKKELNIPVSIRSIKREVLYSADEVFLVGTGAEIQSIAAIDQRRIGTGTVGKVTGTIRDRYQAIVHGEVPQYRKFVTEVSSR